MNIIKKYWDSVYIYILLLIPGLCICAGTYWTICKLFGMYSNLSWTQIIPFDLSHLLYLSIGIYFISEDIFTLASYYQEDMQDTYFFPDDWNLEIAAEMERRLLND